MYAWYEIVGMGFAVGVVCFIVFRGLDLLLEALLKRRQRRDLENLNAVPPAAWRAAEGLRRMADELRKAGPEKGDGAR